MSQNKSRKGLVLGLAAVTIFSSIVPAYARSSYRTITLVRGDQAQEVRVRSQRVEDILKELDLDLDENESSSPAKDQVLEEGQALRINRTENQVTTEIRPIPFETLERENPEMYEGERVLVQEGQEGEIHEEVLSLLVNGEKRSSLVISSNVAKEPVTEIYEYGTKVPENMIHGRKYSQKIRMKGTAYDPSAGSRTAMGTRARVGAVAVDPRVIPLGTELYIESTDSFPTYGFATAEDTGGAIKGNRIDLFYNTNRQARNFGRRDVIVYVLEKE